MQKTIIPLFSHNIQNTKILSLNSTLDHGKNIVKVIFCCIWVGLIASSLHQALM